MMDKKIILQILVFDLKTDYCQWTWMFERRYVCYINIFPVGNSKANIWGIAVTLYLCTCGYVCTRYEHTYIVPTKYVISCKLHLAGIQLWLTNSMANYLKRMDAELRVKRCSCRPCVIIERETNVFYIKNKPILFKLTRNHSILFVSGFYFGLQFFLIYFFVIQRSLIASQGRWIW